MHATLDWTLEEIVKTFPKDPDEMLAYRMPEEILRRASELVALGKTGGLSGETQLEFRRILDLEAQIVGFKGRAFQAKNRAK